MSLCLERVLRRLDGDWYEGAVENDGLAAAVEWRRLVQY